MCFMGIVSLLQIFFYEGQGSLVIINCYARNNGNDHVAYIQSDT